MANTSSTDLTDKQIGEIETALRDGGPIPSGIVIDYTTPMFYRRMTAEETKAAEAEAKREQAAGVPAPEPKVPDAPR